MFKWLIKLQEEQRVDEIIEMLEVKKAIDIVKEKTGAKDIRYLEKDYGYFIFRQGEDLDGYRYPHIHLSADFTIIKILDKNMNIYRVLDLSESREKIKAEFETLFDGLLLQQQSIIKMKKFMKESLLELKK